MHSLWDLWAFAVTRISNKKARHCSSYGKKTLNVYWKVNRLHQKLKLSIRLSSVTGGKKPLSLDWAFLFDARLC
jgi:hypothetical protein